jgi:hypothetical protein
MDKQAVQDVRSEGHLGQPDKSDLWIHGIINI